MREPGIAREERTQQTGQTNRAGDPRHVAAEAAARGDKGRICSKSSRWGRDKILWLRNRQGGGGGPGAWTQSRPSGSTLGLGGVLGASSSPHTSLAAVEAHGAQLSCACTRPALFADRGGHRGERRLRPKPLLGPSPACEQQCLPGAVPHPASTGLCSSSQHAKAALGDPLEVETLAPWPPPAPPASARWPGQPLSFAPTGWLLSL